MNRRDKGGAPSLVATLHGMIEPVTIGLPLEAVLDAIVGQACTSLGGAASALYQLDPGTGNLRVIAAQHLNPSYVADALVPVQSNAPVGIAVAQDQTVVVTDIHDPNGAETLPPSIRKGLHGGFQRFGALIAAPLRRGGEVLGGLVVYDNSPRAFDADEVRLVEFFAERAALILDNAALQSRSRRIEPESSLAAVRTFLTGQPVLLEDITPGIKQSGLLARIAAEEGFHSIATLPIAQCRQTRRSEQGDCPVAVQGGPGAVRVSGQRYRVRSRPALWRARPVDNTRARGTAWRLFGDPNHAGPGNRRSRESSSCRCWLGAAGTTFA